MLKMHSLFVICVIASLLAVIGGAKSSPTGNQSPSKQGDKKISEAISLGFKSLEKSLEKKLDRLVDAVVNATYEEPAEKPEPSSASCHDIYIKHKSQGNKAYLLQINSRTVPVYCHMTDTGLGACGGGGWTLVMKTDGNKPTFQYKSTLWNNKVNYNLPGGKTGFDSQETKLPTYWNTPFSKICLGMKIGNQLKFIFIIQRAHSLYSLIADGAYRATSLGRNTWKTLIGAQASLQLNCNREGFNVVGDSSYADSFSKARIGFIANQENECDTCNSRIGFGTGGQPEDSNTCGNEANANYLPDNGGKHIKAMGYILVQ